MRPEPSVCGVQSVILLCAAAELVGRIRRSFRETPSNPVVCSFNMTTSPGFATTVCKGVTLSALRWPDKPR